MTGHDSTVELSFTVNAGALIRGQVKREIVSFAWSRGLSIDVEEAKSLLESAYRFTVVGEESEVEDFISTVTSWARRVAS